MADTGQVSLGVARVRAQQRADLFNSQFLSTPEWNTLLNSGYKSLYDLMVATYGDAYFMAPGYNFVQTTPSQQLFPLPNGVNTIDTASGLVAAPFYKMLGVDLSDSGTWITLRRFEFIDRNKYLPGSVYNIPGYTNLRYKIMGSYLWFNLPPEGGQAFQLWYIPKPVNLQPVVVVGTTATSQTVTCTDTTQLVVGQSVADYSVLAGASANLAPGSVVTAITPGVSFTVSIAAAGTASNLLAAAWSDTATFDAVAGWTDYVILDAAAKALEKEES